MSRLQNELAELKAKSADLADQFLRAKADAENARRRAEEKCPRPANLASRLCRGLLPVCDSLDAALAIQNATAEQLREGSGATLRQLQSAWSATRCWPSARRRRSSTPLPPGHQHGACGQEANTVVSVLQKGYAIADRILRPALVTVAAPQ